MAYPLIVKEDAPFTRTDTQVYLEKEYSNAGCIYWQYFKAAGFKNIDCVGLADDFVNADNVMRSGDTFSTSSWCY